MKSKQIFWWRIFWILFAFVIIVGALYRISNSDRDILDNSIESLLPNSNDEVAKNYYHKVSSELVFILSTNVDTEQGQISLLDNNVSKLIDILSKYKNIEINGSINPQTLGEFYFKHRYQYPYSLFNNGWLDSESTSVNQDIEEKFVDIAYKKLSKHIITKLYSPFDMVSNTELEADPLLVTRDIVTNSKSQYKLSKSGYLYLTQNNHIYMIVRAKLTDNFVSQQRTDFVSNIKVLKQNLLSTNNIELAYTGSVFFGEAATESSKLDMMKIGIISSIGLLVLLLLAFRSILPLVINLVTLSIALLIGLALTLLLSESIHVITLALASSLIGICCDYIIHFCMHKTHSIKQVNDVLSVSVEKITKDLDKKFWGALLISLCTSVIAYLIMLFTNLRVLHELAIFAIGSLVSTYILVKYFWGPSVICDSIKKKHLDNKESNQSISCVVPSKSKRTINKAILYVVNSALFFIGGIVFFNLPNDDDVASMQKVDSELSNMNILITQLLYGDKTTAWLILEGQDEEDSLLKCEELLKGLSKNEQEQILAPCSYIHSKKAQLYSYELYKKLMPKIVALYEEQGIVIENKAQEIPKFNQITFNNYPIDLSLVHDNNTLLLRVNTQGKSSNDLLFKLKSKDYVRALDSRAQWSQAFRDYRIYLEYIVIITLLLSTAFLAYVMKTKVFIYYMLPIVSGIGLGLLVNWLYTGYFNLFTALACFMILGLGADYSIFAFRSGKDNYRTTLETLFIACITTELAFGMLAFSNTYVISSFGTTLSIGLGCVFVLISWIMHTYKYETKKQEH